MFPLWCSLFLLEVHSHFLFSFQTFYSNTSSFTIGYWLGLLMSWQRWFLLHLPKLPSHPPSFVFPSGLKGKRYLFWCRATCSSWVLIFLSWSLHTLFPLPDQHHSVFSFWNGLLITIVSLISSLVGQDPVSVSPSLSSPRLEASGGQGWGKN